MTSKKVGVGWGGVVWRGGGVIRLLLVLPQPAGQVISSYNISRLSQASYTTVWMLFAATTKMLLWMSWKCVQVFNRRRFLKIWITWKHEWLSWIDSADVCLGRGMPGRASTVQKLCLKGHSPNFALFCRCCTCKYQYDAAIILTPISRSLT